MNSAGPELLDRALADGSAADGSVAPLVDIASEIEAVFAAPAPSASTERAVFIRGVAAHASRPSAWRFVTPAAVVISLLALLGFLSHAAVPGQTLYPVRKAMSSIGLAQTPLAEAEHRIAAAESLITRAEGLVDSDPAQADALALRTITNLGIARQLLRDVKESEAGTRFEKIADLEERAKAVIIAVDGTEQEASGGHGRGTSGAHDAARAAGVAGESGEAPAQPATASDDTVFAGDAGPSGSQPVSNEDDSDQSEAHANPSQSGTEPDEPEPSPSSEDAADEEGHDGSDGGYEGNTPTQNGLDNSDGLGDSSWRVSVESDEKASFEDGQNEATGNSSDPEESSVQEDAGGSEDDPNSPP